MNLWDFRRQHAINLMIMKAVWDKIIFKKMLLLLVVRLRNSHVILIWIIVRSCVISICIEWLIICSDHRHSILCLKTKIHEHLMDHQDDVRLNELLCTHWDCLESWNWFLPCTGYKHFVISFYKRKMGDYVFHWYLAVPQGNFRLWKKRKKLLWYPLWNEWKDAILWMVGKLKRMSGSDKITKTYFRRIS